MRDLLLVGVMALVCGGIGIPAARLLPFSVFRWRLLAAPTFGIAILGVAVNVAYVFGVAPRLSLVLAAGVALVLLAAEVRRWARGDASGAADVAERRAILAFLLVWIGSVGLLLAPRWVGGDQFAVFQGNHWDTFGYLESAVVYARVPYEALATAGAPEFLRNPLVEVAAGNLATRPAVHLLYAAFSGVAPADAARLHYAFLVFLLSQSALVVSLLLRSWLPRARVPLLIAVALVFELGFWGQYAFDINSWSQVGAISMLLLLVGLMIETAAPPRSDAPLSERRRLAWPLAVVVAGAVYVYPEGLLYHLGVLVPLVVAALVVRAFRARRASIEPYVPLLGLAGAAAGFLYWRGTLGVIVGQLRVVGQVVEWWRFFQGFFMGRDGVFLHRGGGFAAAADFVAGLFGLYFATPGESSASFAALYPRVVLLVFVIALLGALAALLAKRGAPEGESPAFTFVSSARVRLGALAAAALLVPAAIMAAQGNYWPAGKGVSFASPVFMTLLALPLLAAPSARARWLPFVTAAFVLFQIGTGVARIAAARDPSGIHYASPYPSIQDENLKRFQRWELESLEPRLAGTRRILVAPIDPWLAAYVTTSLYARGVDVFPAGPIGPAGSQPGAMPASWKPDAIVAQGGTGLVLLSTDDWAPAAVTSPAGMR